MFKFHVSVIKESGAYGKMKSSYDDIVGPKQLCTEYDGKAVGIHKSFSILGVILAGIFLGFVLLT